MTQNINGKWISSFWRRIGAISIDIIALGIFGLVLGLMFEKTFVELEGWGRLVGFAIAFFYFGILNSAIGGGQTLGKRILNIRVVGANNAPIGLGKSVVRYITLAFPFLLNGAQIPIDDVNPHLHYFNQIIVTGGLLSIVYLYLFNRVTRQSLHDLAVSTYVVNTQSEKQDIGRIWNVHIMVAIVLFIIGAATPIIISNLFIPVFSNNEQYLSIHSAHKALLKEPNIANANILSSTTTIFHAKDGEKTTKTFISSDVLLTINEVNDVELARRIAFIIISNYPEALKKDELLIVLNYGWDIGIASKWNSRSFRFNPKDSIESGVNAI